MAEKVTLKVSGRSYRVDRREFTDPKVSVLRAMSAAANEDYEPVFRLPELFGLDATDWHMSDMNAFLEQVGEQLQEAQGVEVPESSGSSTSSTSTVKKSNTSASATD